MELDLLVPHGCPPDPPSGPGESLAQAMPGGRQMFQLASLCRTRSRTLVSGSTGMIILDSNVLLSLFGVSTFTQPERESRRGGNRTSHRHRELQWLRAHREELRPLIGQWVVIEGEEIVAYGSNPVEVVREARRKGVKVPFIRQIEMDRRKGIGEIGL